jgi:hypothetical protein
VEVVKLVAVVEEVAVEVSLNKIMQMSPQKDHQFNK